MSEFQATYPEEFFNTYPAVYAVHNEYQIMVSVKKETLMWCEVNGRSYYDESCGILRSQSFTHRMTVPMSELDQAGSYTICFRHVIERKPYFSETGDIIRLSYRFRPVRGTSVRIYHIADTHNREAAPISSAPPVQDLDLLILNGDIPEDCGKIENFKTIHKISGDISRGEIPVIFARGNHDLRGIYAEKLIEHIPNENGITYYSFRLGPVWGLVLDCSEDKVDTNPAYGNTVVCHDFRLKETEFLKNLVRHPEEEFGAPGISYRLIICHAPFTQIKCPPFDIEQDLYREWCRLIGAHIRPHLMLSGHNHALYITLPGEERDHLGQSCPVVVGAMPGRADTPPGTGGTPDEFIGSEVDLRPGKAQVRFVDQDRVLIRTTDLELRQD